MEAKTTRSLLSHVLFVPFRGVAVAGNMSPLKWKRRAVWDNAERNKMVADLAEGLATNARKALRKLGVKFKDAKLPERVRQRVVILAETAEKARRLGKLLPAWVVQDAIPVDHEPEGWEEALMPLNIGNLDVSCHLVVSYSLFAL